MKIILVGFLRGFYQYCQPRIQDFINISFLQSSSSFSRPTRKKLHRPGKNANKKNAELKCLSTFHPVSVSHCGGVPFSQKEETGAKGVALNG